MKNLTNRQVSLAFTFLDRVALDRDYRMLPMSARYDRALALVRANIADPLIAGDIGVTDLVAITAYFLTKRDQMTAKEAALQE